jgi:hypothetical protein
MLGSLNWRKLRNQFAAHDRLCVRHAVNRIREDLGFHLPPIKTEIEFVAEPPRMYVAHAIKRTD